MSLRSIAAKAGVSDSSLSRYLRNHYDITSRVASDVVEVVMPDWNATTEFVYGVELTDRLDYMTKATQGDIRVVGSNCYSLDSLEAAVHRGIDYQLVINSSEHMPDRLTEHIKNAAKSPSFTLYQTPLGCQPMILTDTDAVLLMPGPNGAAGIHLTGDDHLGHFGNYFGSILNDARTERIIEDYRK